MPLSKADRDSLSPEERESLRFKLLAATASVSSLEVEYLLDQGVLLSAIRGVFSTRQQVATIRSLSAALGPEPTAEELAPMTTTELRELVTACHGPKSTARNLGFEASTITTALNSKHPPSTRLRVQLRRLVKSGKMRDLRVPTKVRNPGKQLKSERRYY